MPDIADVVLDIEKRVRNSNNDGWIVEHPVTKAANVKTDAGNDVEVDLNNLKTNSIPKTLVTAVNDFIVGTAANAVSKKTLAETKAILGIATASATVAGQVELATAAEVTAGTDATRAVTPAGLKVELDKKALASDLADMGTQVADTMPKSGGAFTGIISVPRLDMPLGTRLQEEATRTSLRAMSSRFDIITQDGQNYILKADYTNDIFQFKGRKVLTQTDYDTLFQYANNGKSIIADVIGGVNVNNTHAQIRDRVTAINNVLNDILQSSDRSTLTRTIDWLNQRGIDLANQLNAKGVPAVNTDGLSTLIQKVANINTGKRFATGNMFVNGSAFFRVFGLTFKPSIVRVYFDINNWAIGFLSPDAFEPNPNKGIRCVEGNLSSAVFGSFSDGWSLQYINDGNFYKWTAYE